MIQYDHIIPQVLIAPDDAFVLIVLQNAQDEEKDKGKLEI